MQQIRFGDKSVTPSKVVCVGRNYVAHIEELGNEIPENMVIFNKPNSAICDTLHFYGPDCRFEGEICLLVKERRIIGLGLGLDLTHAAIQNRLKQKGLPWERAKAFNGAAVLSRFVAFEGKLDQIHFTLTRNGKLQQEADYSLMMYKPQEIIEEIEHFMHLEPYDVIMTGTPKGVDTYAQGDRFQMQLFDGKRLLLTSNWTAK